MKESNELWRPVEGYEGYYEVSDKGRVRSLGGRRGSSERILKQASTKGYLSVALSVNNKRKTWQVHRLVIDAFQGNKLFVEINHKDGDKTNNHNYNLEWVSHQGNMDHAAKTSLFDNKGEKHGMHKLTEAEVSYILQSSKEVSHLAQYFGVSRQTIKDIKSGKSWKHLTLKLHEEKML